jgi:hypothetical protein
MMQRLGAVAMVQRAEKPLPIQTPLRKIAQLRKKDQWFSYPMLKVNICVQAGL